jgi:hypothetical protein
LVTLLGALGQHSSLSDYATISVLLVFVLVFGAISALFFRQSVVLGRRQVILTQARRDADEQTSRTRTEGDEAIRVIDAKISAVQKALERHREIVSQ